MRFLLKNIKLSSILYTQILVCHFILIFISNFIATLPSPAVDTANPNPSLNSGFSLTDTVTNQIGYNIETNSENAQKIPISIDTIPQIGTSNNGNFPLDSIPPAMPLLKKGPTEGIEFEKEETTIINLDNDEDNDNYMDTHLPLKGSSIPSQMNEISDTINQEYPEINENTDLDDDEDDPLHHKYYNFFDDDDLPTTGSINPDQMNGISDTINQELTKTNENINLGNDDEDDPLHHKNYNLFDDDDLPTTGSINQDQINGILETNDQDQNMKNIDSNGAEGQHAYQAFLQGLMNHKKVNPLETDEPVDVDEEAKEENDKIVQQLSQHSTAEQNLLEEGINDDKLIEPTSLSDQEKQLIVEKINTHNQELKQDSILENGQLSDLNVMDNLVTEQMLLQKEAIDTTINNVLPTKPIGLLGSEPQQISTLANITKISKKKRKKVPYIIEYKGEARVFCTFGTQVLKMYNKVKQYFIQGHLCHAIVYGVPLTIEANLVSMSNDDLQELTRIHRIKRIPLLVVIMRHSSYEAWSMALKTPKKEVKIIMKFIRKFKIGGIQFTNLEPSPGDQLDTDMTCKLIIFFEMLTKATEAIKHEIKIGLAISPYAQTATTGFQSFNVLNDLVNWYSLQTISMVQCTPAYMAGTSPLDGTISLTTSFLELMKTDIRKDKVIISIQLFANKFGSLQPFSYIDMCLLQPISWNKWCAARPEDFRLKGEFLRNLEIWGVQLYYMESDDHEALCDCYKFPMIRALLRGMSKREQPPGECDYLGKVENRESRCSYENILPDIEARMERQYKQALKEINHEGT